MPEILLRVCWEDGHTTEDDVINAMDDVPAEVHYADPATIVGDVAPVRDFAKLVAEEMAEQMATPPTTPLAWTAQHGGTAWPAGYKAGLTDARAIVARAAPMDSASSGDEHQSSSSGQDG